MRLSFRSLLKTPLIAKGNPRACGPHGAASPTPLISNSASYRQWNPRACGPHVAQSRPAGAASLVASPTVTISLVSKWNLRRFAPHRVASPTACGFLTAQQCFSCHCLLFKEALESLRYVDSINCVNRKS